MRYTVVMLGSGSYRVVVTGRGGRGIIGEFDGDMIRALRWERKLDDTADSEIDLYVSNIGSCAACDLLSQIDPLATEITIFRNGLPVWMGPITLWEAGRTSAVLQAKDLGAWLDWRVVHEDIVSAAPYPLDLVRIAEAIVKDALGEDNPNIKVITSDGFVFGERSVLAADYRVAQDELSELFRTDVDMIVVGRTIQLYGTETPRRVLPPLSDEDILEDIRVRRNGLIMANRVIVNGNNDLWGVYPPIGQEGSTVYGLKERVFNEPTILDQASLDQAAKSRYELLNRPVTSIEVPSGARLSPTAPVEINDLIPGFRQRITVLNNCVKVSGLFRLDSVSVTYDNSGESVRVSYQPIGGTLDSGV